MICFRCREIEADGEIGEAVSVRHQFIHQFAVWMELNGFAPSAECVVEREPGKRYYRVGWMTKDKVIGGEVKIFGPEWIMVRWHGDVDWMPMSGSRIFAHEITAQAFMLDAFRDREWRFADAIPQRNPERKKRVKDEGN